MQSRDRRENGDQKDCRGRGENEDPKANEGQGATRGFRAWPGPAAQQAPRALSDHKACAEMQVLKGIPVIWALRVFQESRGQWGPRATADRLDHKAFLARPVRPDPKATEASKEKEAPQENKGLWGNKGRREKSDLRERRGMPAVPARKGIRGPWGPPD